MSAVERNPVTYEHIAPETVGNRRRILISDLAGRANLLAKARELGVELSDEQRVLDELKRLEHDGYEFEAAEASFELLVSKLRGAHQPYFELLGFRVIDEHGFAQRPRRYPAFTVATHFRILYSAPENCSQRSSTVIGFANTVGPARRSASRLQVSSRSRLEAGADY